MSTAHMKTGLSKATVSLAIIVLSAFHTALSYAQSIAVDEINCHIIKALDLPMADTIAVVNLSSVEILRDGTQKIFPTGTDSAFVTVFGTSKLYAVRNDLVLILNAGQQGLFYSCLIPEVENRLSHGREYYRVGNAGGIQFREYGVASTSLVPILQLTLADNDTLTDAWIERTVYQGALDTEPEGAPYDWDSHISIPDTIRYKLTSFTPMSDSICKVTVKDKLYTPEYEHPLLIQERTVLFENGEAVDSLIYSCFYPSHNMNKLPSPENKDSRYPGIKEERNPYPAETDMDSAITPSLGLTVNPSITAGNAYATILPAENGFVTVSIATASGVTVWNSEYQCDSEAIRIPLNLSAYPAGIYVVSASQAQYNAAVRIIKI